MKHLIVTGFVLLTALFSLHAQSPILKAYYEVKEALVNADAGNASIKAAEFAKTLNSMDMITIPADRQDAVLAMQIKLIADVGRILAAKDIDKQRENFANLSLSLYSLAKLARLSNQPVYEAYCPMKKMYWLSSEKSIRNPYYGRMMLTCGNITETINP
jgi:Protein of unknown function (DUF3347)